MKHQKLLRLSLILGLVLAFQVGCSAPATPVPPTVTPVPPTPTPQSGPNVGHWEGDPSFSFEVGTDGQIHNFEMEIDGGNNSACIVTVDSISVESDGTIQFTFGETTLEGANTIKGKFESNVTFSGTRSGAITCSNSSGQMLGILSVEDPPITAEWKGP